MRRIGILLGLLLVASFGVGFAQTTVRIDLVHAPLQQNANDLVPTLLEAGALTKCYGFFCRQELKGDKVLPIPVRIRVGNMQQNDWLEQKTRTLTPVR